MGAAGSVNYEHEGEGKVQHEVVVEKLKAGQDEVGQKDIEEKMKEHWPKENDTYKELDKEEFDTAYGEVMAKLKPAEPEAEAAPAEGEAAAPAEGEAAAPAEGEAAAPAEGEAAAPAEGEAEAAPAEGEAAAPVEGEAAAPAEGEAAAPAEGDVAAPAEGDAAAPAEGDAAPAE